MKHLLLASFVFFAGGANAESPNDVPSTASLTASTNEIGGSPGKLTGAADLRPSYLQEKSTFHTENEFSLKYQFTRPFSLAYVQEFRTNLSNQNDTRLDFRLADGYLRSDVENFWVDGRRGLSLSYQGRLYVPTGRDTRPSGFLGELRTGLRFGWKFHSIAEIALKEIPVVPAYSRAAVEIDGELTAMPWFENRAEIELNVAITDKLSLKVPLILQSFRHRLTADAKYSGQWKHDLWVYPELVYSFTPNTGVGLGYYSASLSDGTGRGFKNGVPQLILQQSI